MVRIGCCKWLVLPVVLVGGVSSFAVMPKFTYCNPYEAMNGVSMVGREGPGQFVKINRKLDEWRDDGACYGSCLYLDQLGGQKINTPAVDAKARQWCAAKWPEHPKYYKSKIVKQTDRRGRETQDYFLAKCKVLKEVFEYAVLQANLLGFDEKELKDVGDGVSRFMNSSDWRLLGEIESKTAVKGVVGLTGTINKDVLPPLEKLLVRISMEKSALRQRFVQRNPNVNDEVLLKQKIEERRRKWREEEEERNKNCGVMQIQADENLREANRNGENGSDAQREQAYLDDLDTRSFLRIQKLKNKQKYKDAGLQFRQSPPAVSR